MSNPPASDDDDVSANARRALVVAAVLTALLPLVPLASLLARPFVWLQTFAHESGHGLTSLLVGGSGFSLRIFADGSGVAPWHTAATASAFASTPAASAVVAIGGLVGPAVASALFFGAARHRASARVALAALAALSFVAAVVVVENLFGKIAVLAWSIAFAAAAVALDGAKPQIACAFAGIDLGLSVFSRGDYLFASTAHTAEGDHASDVVLVATGLGGFSWAWGAVIGVASVAVVAAGLALLVRRRSVCARRRAQRGVSRGARSPS